MAFLKACYTRSETYTPNPILFAGASGDQVETEQTARSPVKYLEAEPKYPPDRHSTAKEANTRQNNNNNSLLLGEGVSRSPSPWFQPVQTPYPSLCPSRCTMLQSPSSTRPPPPPTQERTSSGGGSISSGTRPSLSILARKTALPGFPATLSRPLPGRSS